MKRENEMLDLIATLRPGERKIMAATIEDRMFRIAKARRRLEQAWDQVRPVEDEDEREAAATRKEAVIRIDLEIPKSVAIHGEGEFTSTDAREQALRIPRWIRGEMTEEDVEMWHFQLSELADLDCGWIFFDQPGNFYKRDPSKEVILDQEILAWMIEVGTRKATD